MRYSKRSIELAERVREKALRNLNRVDADDDYGEAMPWWFMVFLAGVLVVLGALTVLLIVHGLNTP